MIGDLLSMEDLTADQVVEVLDAAEGFKDIALRPIKKVPTLRGRTVCNLFFEASTRTRISFELAEKRLSADVINFSASGSSVDKGESLKDTALTLEAMGVDAIVIRHAASGAPEQLTRWVAAKVLNAGDGWHQHPTQALLDLFTIRERFGRIEGLRAAVVGDVLHSRVARSVIQGLVTMGAQVTVVSPPTLLPDGVESWGTTVAHDLDEVVAKTDVLYLLRVQSERMQRQFFPSVREYTRLWGMDQRRLSRLPADAIVMHPGPLNRGVELAADVADAERAVITDQVTNGIAVRMSCLYLMLGGEGERGSVSGRGVERDEGRGAAAGQAAGRDEGRGAAAGQAAGRDEGRGAAAGQAAGGDDGRGATGGGQAFERDDGPGVAAGGGGYRGEGMAG